MATIRFDFEDGRSKVVEVSESHVQSWMRRSGQPRKGALEDLVNDLFWRALRAEFRNTPFQWAEV